MMRAGTWRRAAFGGAAVVAVIAIAGAIALHALVDPERLKAKAREKARETWSRDLAIGDMSLHLLPLPSLYASDVTVGDAPGDSDPWHLHADRVVVGLELWPLLKGESRPRDVRIEGDVTHHDQRMKVAAVLDDISRYGEPDATSDGKVDLDWGKTQVTATGTIPLQAELHGAALKAQLQSKSLNDMLGFFDIERPRATAPAQASLELRSAGERLEFTAVDATIGKHRLTGDMRISTSGARPVIDAHLRSERFDWVQFLAETGSPPLPPLPPEELFHDRPIAWPLLVALQGKDGTIDVQLGSLRLRQGIELQAARSSMVFTDDTLDLKSYSAKALGGSVRGTMRFVGRKKTARIHFEGTGLLLERWFKERRRDTPFTGGPMTVTASLDASGNSMRDFAHSMTGPVTIRMGPGIYASQKAGDAEALMVAFSKKDSTGQITFECAGANLPFVQGRAAGDAIVGARSDVSRLLTSGYVSLRDVSADLRGRVHPKPGMGVGLATIDGDIRISGNLHALHAKLDPAHKPAGAVRAGVAIATLGLSLAARAAKESARGDSDPCAEVFEKGKPR